MFFSFFKNHRRKRWLATPFPSSWAEWLRTGIWQYQHLSQELWQRVEEFVCVLVNEKHWVGGGDFEVIEKMKVIIAGQAAMLTFGFGRPYYFDRLKSVIVYPGAYASRPESTDGLFLGNFSDKPFGSDVRAGEAWQGGPIVLTWDAVEAEGRNARRGRNVVLHEFAHHMDGLDGDTNGTPPMTDMLLEKKWYRITSEEHLQLLTMAQRGIPTLIDKYGATNHAEFFAVATECFFSRPHQLAVEHMELFGVLVRLFGQDPRDWLRADADECPVLPQKITALPA